MKKSLEQVKLDLVEEINDKQKNKIIEPTNASLLTKLINNAESITEAFAIAELGTTYKKTGFNFEKIIEKIGTDYKYLKKNDDLSFVNNVENNTHKLIIGDNYDSLLNLLITHKCKIDIIYIDPPYGKDNMGKYAKTNYTNAITRDNLLSMLYPRLQLAKQLLSDDGVIFCSIDDKNQAYIKCLMDEIFGEKNYCGTYMWYKQKTPPNLSTKIRKNLEFILCYQKYKNNNKFKGTASDSKSTDPTTKPQNSLKEWRFKPHQLICNMNDGIYNAGTYGTQKFPNILKNDLVVKNGLNENEIVFKNRFIWIQETLEETLKKASIYLSKSLVLSYKRNEYDCPVPSNLIDESDKVDTTEEAGKQLSEIFYTSTNTKIFDYPKPVSLIKYLINFIDKPNTIILDFFAGSGTTGQAVMELNREDGGSRKFILCTNNEITESNPNGIAYDVTSKRLKRIMSGECYDGLNDFKWIKDNRPYMDNLEVYEVNTVHNSEQGKGKSPFDVIDETCYDLPEFKSIEEKISWICSSFENTQKYLEEK